MKLNKRIGDIINNFQGNTLWNHNDLVVKAKPYFHDHVHKRKC